MSRASEVFVPHVVFCLSYGYSVRLWWVGFAVGAMFAKKIPSAAVYQRLLHVLMRAVA